MSVGAQVRMARAALRLGIRELAQLADVSPTTVTKIEADQPTNRNSIRAVQAALETSGIEFIQENGVGVGVRLKRM